MEQPNITSDGDAALTPVFWVVVALTGVAAGLFGDLMMVILFNVQYLAFGYHTGSFQAGVEHAPAVRRVSSLLIAGVFGGVAWFVLRRYTKGEHSEIDEAIWHGDGRLSLRRCLGTSVISEVVIGMGASLGREAAPKLLGGASASVFAGWAGLSVQQRRLLVACGGGAGLAAVYNVPLGGALFTAEVLYGTVSLPVGKRGIRRAVHPDAEHRRRPRRLPRNGLEPGLARLAIGRVRHDRRRSHDRRGHAGAPGRARPGTRAHRQRLRADGPDDGRYRDRHRHRLLHRRILDLLRAPAVPSRGLAVGRDGSTIRRTTTTQ
jgi:hypothetical protein